MEVLIRPYQLEDAQLLHEAGRESVKVVYPWLPWCHPDYKLEEARDYVELQVKLFEEKKEFSFAICSSEGRFLGGCGLNGIEKEDQRANLGYWVRSSALRQGVASRAARQLADWAFENTELNRLEIVIAVDNLASKGVAEKIGAIEEGIARKRLLLHGVAHDAVIYSLVRE